MKNTLLDDLKNLIETARADREKYVKKIEEEPADQYGILAFKELYWSTSPNEDISDNTERSKRYRKYIYCTLNAIDTNKLKELSEIILLSGQTENLLEIFKELGNAIEDVIVSLYSKKDTLNELEILDLENIKNSFEKLLSTRTVVSEMINQLLLDYKDDKDSIKTNNTKLKFHVHTLLKQIIKKSEEKEKLKSDILSIKNF
ncbi:virulence associated lipoprotein [Borreliella bavariensis]|uniref:virulence associated lipoprotein n=1 Tax=Borreliella bavariensis TaxID=664662 RepID=UPI002D7E7CC1|nr:virulence associated lipoprotein [Borreliella bavariensis]